MSLQRINIALTIDSAYCQHATVVLTSLLQNNLDSRFRLFVATTEPIGSGASRMIESIARFENAELRFLDLSEINLVSDLTPHGHLNIASYARLLLPERLPKSIDRVIYLDSDVVVLSDIRPLWELELENYHLAAVRDIPYDHQDLRLGASTVYFNSGVLVINLEKWRSSNATRELIELASSLKKIDQDVLNIRFQDSVLLADLKWNFQVIIAEMPNTLNLSYRQFRALRKSPAIIHYSGQYKPWNYMDEVHYRSIYYDYLALTAFWPFSPVGRSPRARIFKLIRMKVLKRKIRWLLHLR